MAYTPPQPGQIITAGLLTGLAGEWTDYTPTLTNTTLGDGTLIARYQQVANRVIVMFILNWGSTTSGNMPFLSVPVPPASLGGMRWSGTVLLSRGSGRFRTGATWLYDTNTSISSGVHMSSTPTDLDTNLATAGVTMGAGGWIAGNIEYEAA